MTASITVPEVANHVPHVQILLDKAVTGITGQEISKKLREGTPRLAYARATNCSSECG